MTITTVLFDLDGTLLPMDQDQFTKGYFHLLSSTLSPYGYDANRLIQTIWAGTNAMVNNDGSQTNEAVFWQVFSGVWGEDALKDRPLFEQFYQTEFQKAKAFCQPTPYAAQTVQALRHAGRRIVLATNPIFPAIATESRIRWAGLSPDDFERYTTYENSNYCKPNPNYYQALLETLGVRPQECLMVGNDVTEDMVAQTLGIEVFLLTDCLINKERKNISVYPRGSFPQLLHFFQ